MGKEAGSSEAAFGWKVMRKTEVDRRWLAKDRLVQPSGRCVLCMAARPGFTPGRINTPPRTPAPGETVPWHTYILTKKGNLPFEHELFEAGLCYKGLIIRAAWENWASANPKWSSDLKKLQVTAEVVAMMPALSLMHPESLSSSVGKVARNQ